ncbi:MULTISPECIES: phosphoglycerate dehydrogenase [Bradyrhizobium]|jgi:D-3-phosphoglycerate dehydrogenase|uniref:D-3-phosphoglycerate dehydrogenase n=2 Tax=Bradyrhizobium TaxID=374 RepID=A0ABS5G305_9BRAD|nr:MULTISPECIES: phosphoglycerate dehydrogenase [Bradyrhizobium]RTL92138.1 MAG: phosphoglycerate dehydrogenase [Bradyrhizobiaceae bacterium]MBR1135551.1 phosphoglycerate dehydrogenase [Bradyrhizobium denitrificans]MCL8489339.1 phosphoglycerate dehydrogenase [Bradyrhizobium denitrificans]MDU0956183.1 phosphoglycerate dehydrogenase [Bradyrhizobium sp.]MDU1494852.1 phosphoglycerate dehydrogenase [Bradyrhizobium sp.]
MPLSLPKQKIRVLLLEGVNDSAVRMFEANGYTEIERLPKALGSAELKRMLSGVHMLGIRSRTHLTEDVLQAADRLMVVGCFSVGTNQVDLDAAKRLGIPVFNAPYSNTRSVAELTIAEVVMLMRRIFPRSVAAHAGGWDKSANGSREVRGKTLGIIGYGNIGSQLSNLAEAMGMRVIFFDLTDKLRHGNTEPVESLDELLAMSDVVSLHVPETPATANMIGERQIRHMKDGAYLINNSRGTVVDIEALASALRDGKLAGAAVDVFPVEPASNADPFVSPLQGLPNVILTPHVGGSTEEAQDRIGGEVARKLIDYSDVGSTFGAVNFPQVQLPARPTGTRFIHVHRNVPGVLRQVNEAVSRHNINILAQYLQTDPEVGYVVLETDVVGGEGEELLSELRAVEGTIRVRVLYDHDRP